jgi:hypothetical protein
MFFPACKKNTTSYWNKQYIGILCTGTSIPYFFSFYRCLSLFDRIKEVWERICVGNAPKILNKIQENMKVQAFLVPLTKHRRLTNPTFQLCSIYKYALAKHREEILREWYVRRSECWRGGGRT